MKLRYLLLAIIAVCGLPSCSDDNGNGIELPEDTMVEANISLVAIPQGTQTKATDVGSTAERFVQTLTAYVFYADGDRKDQFAGMGKAESDGINSLSEIKNIVVKVKAKGVGELSDTKLKMVLLANTNVGKTPAKLSDVTDASLEGIAGLNAVGAYLPMYSQVIDINAKILVGLDYNNWVLAKTSGVQYTNQANNKLESADGGWTEKDAYMATSDDRIELVRHVARIQLESLNADFKNNYDGASFTLKKVYVANASDNTKLYAVDGGSEYGLEKAGKYLHGCGYIRDNYFLVEGTNSVSSLGKDYGTGLIVNNSVSQSFTTDKVQFYVFELSNENPMRADANNLTTPPADRKINTMLILEGTWKYAVGDKTDTRYYRVPIRAKQNGTEPGVIHNTIYKISATLTGEGSTDPDTEDLNTCIRFQIKVEDWKVISQTETD